MSNTPANTKPTNEGESWYEIISEFIVGLAIIFIAGIAVTSAFNYLYNTFNIPNWVPGFTSSILIYLYGTLARYRPDALIKYFVFGLAIGPVIFIANRLAEQTPCLLR